MLIANYKTAVFVIIGGEGVRERLRLLSARELDVLGYFLNGETDEQVADKLSLSERTVEGHRARIYRKFGIHTVKELALLMPDIKAVWQR